MVKASKTPQAACRLLALLAVTVAAQPQQDSGAPRLCYLCYILTAARSRSAPKPPRSRSQQPNFRLSICSSVPEAALSGICSFWNWQRNKSRSMDTDTVGVQIRVGMQAPARGESQEPCHTWTFQLSLLTPMARVLWAPSSNSTLTSQKAVRSHRDLPQTEQGSQDSSGAYVSPHCPLPGHASLT